MHRCDHWPAVCPKVDCTVAKACLYIAMRLIRANSEVPLSVYTKHYYAKSKKVNRRKSTWYTKRSVFASNNRFKLGAADFGAPLVLLLSSQSPPIRLYESSPYGDRYNIVAPKVCIYFDYACIAYTKQLSYIYIYIHINTYICDVQNAHERVCELWLMRIRNILRHVSGDFLHPGASSFGMVSWRIFRSFGNRIGARARSGTCFA